MIDIIFTGPFGGVNRKRRIIGGGESGNLKTLAILKSLGKEVFLIEKPYKGSGLFSTFVHLFMLFYFVLKVWFIVFVKKPKYLHISGFYGRLVFFEYLISLLSKCSTAKVVYELRAGGADDMYESGSFLYKYFFRTILRNSSYILCQGERYLKFSELLLSQSETKMLFYPNFISQELAEYRVNDFSKPHELTLVYFGRIVEEKNIFFMIDVLFALNHSLKCSLKLVGAAQDVFLEKVISYADSKNCKDNLDIRSGVNGKKLYSEVEDSHFFIFPTNEPREGHSNSLTEAMALGIVPIVSNHGFNSFVVGDDFLVINEFEPDLYADKIKIIFDGQLETYSKKMRDRVMTKFTYQNAVQVLEKVYASK